MNSNALAISSRNVFNWRSVAYALLLGAGVGIFFLIRHYGETLTAPAAMTLETGSAVSATRSAKPASVDLILHVTATLVAVITSGFLLGRICSLLGQPPVIGEILAGLALGPSLLGMISPDAMHSLIPAAAQDPHGQVVSALKAISQLGVILYMFLVGLELNAAHLHGKAQSAIVVSHASIVVPFVLGATLALLLYPILSTSDVSFTTFALFMGVAMSVTAFPVLARILTDRGLDKTTIGAIALACAAADDVTAWCLLALVVGVAQAKIGQALTVALLSLGFIAVMILAIRPLASRFIRRFEDPSQALPAIAVYGMFVLVLLSAMSTEAIGIHAVFGAFLFGVIIPSDSRIAREFTMKLKDPVTVLLLPAFFALTGMRTEIGLVSGWQNWLLCILIVLVATLGKFGGTLVAARLTGFQWREAAALGVLMNTRGLMELIVLNIGLDLGVISPTLFAMMVIMAIATTVITAPILKLVLPEEKWLVISG